MGTGNDEARKMTEMKDIMKPPGEEDHLSLRRKRTISEVTSRKMTLGFALVLFFFCDFCCTCFYVPHMQRAKNKLLAPTHLLETSKKHSFFFFLITVTGEKLCGFTVGRDTDFSSRESRVFSKII